MTIVSQVKTVLSPKCYSLAFSDCMKGSLICGYILWKNNSIKSGKPMAFRITCVQIYIHILNTDKLEIDSLKERKKKDKTNKKTPTNFH